MTVECWVKFRGRAVGDVVCRGGQYMIRVSDAVTASFWIDGAWRNVTGDRSVPVDRWTHLAITWDQGTKRTGIYVDGRLDVAEMPGRRHGRNARRRAEHVATGRAHLAIACHQPQRLAGRSASLVGGPRGPAAARIGDGPSANRNRGDAKETAGQADHRSSSSRGGGPQTRRIRRSRTSRAHGSQRKRTRCSRAERWTDATAARRWASA